MKKILITDWIEQFNYHNIILDISEIVSTGHVLDLVESLKNNYVNKLHRLEYAIRGNRLICIENCDLQDCDLHLMDLEDYKVYRLLCDKNCIETYFYYNKLE